MARVLIVEDDGLVARQMARTLRDAGHSPALAPDGRSALEGAAERPDVVLLDLGLPDLPGEEILKHLKSQPNTAHIPVLVITGRREAAAQLGRPEMGRVPEILFKPVSAAQLCRAVNVALEGKADLDTEALRLVHERQRDLIKRILIKGSGKLAYQLCLRLSADLTSDNGATPAEALSWDEITEWAMREALVDAEQASLLRRIPLTRPQIFRKVSS